MASQTITPSTTFVTIDTLQSPFTTVVLSTSIQGQTVTVLDRTASASIANPIIISSVVGPSTIIDQPSGFVTLQAQANGSSWSYLNTFPFWNQEISSGVSILTTSTLYTNINSTTVETLTSMNVENLVITGLFPPAESATFVQTMTVMGHTEVTSSFRANAAFTISSYLSTFSTLHLASSLTVGGPIIIQSTLTALSSFFVSSVVTARSLSTGLLTVAGSLSLSSIDLQQSTGTTLTIGGNLVVQKGLTVLSSVTTGNSVRANSLFVGSSLSTVTMAVGSNLLSMNVSTGSLFQNDSLTVAGYTHFYGTTTVVSSVTAYSANMKNTLSLDNSLNVSTAFIQSLFLGTLSNGGQTSVSSQISTLQNLNVGTFVASSTQLAVQGSFSTIGSLYDMANLTTVSSMQIQGSAFTPSTLTVGGNSLFKGSFQVAGNIAFTSSLSLVSSLNVHNTLSINTLLTNVSTTIIGNLNAASTVNVSGIAWLSSYSLPSAATVNKIFLISSLVAGGTAAVSSTVITLQKYTSLFTQQINSGSRNWFACASSANGTKLIAVVYNEYIYTSTDSGLTWTQQTSPGIRTWYGCASSADGTKLVSVAYSNFIYTSTDSGVTWTQQTNSSQTGLYGCASSADGTKLVAIPLNGYIYTSTDSGVSWTRQTAAGSRTWHKCASSADGTKLIAVVNGGYIYTSTDSGVSWTQQTNAGSRAWYSCDSSADGTKLIAAVYGDYIYTSTDSGLTWTQQTNSGSRGWNGCASSTDGTKFIAVANTSYIYTSTDSGLTWTQQTISGSRHWYGCASSADGTKLIAVAGGNGFTDYIYTGLITSITNFYTSSLGIGYASTPYALQIPYMISTQSAVVSTLSTVKLASYGPTLISTTMAIGMSSLGKGLDVAGLAKVNGSLYAFQTISSQQTYASSITGMFYGDARGLYNFGLQSNISTSRLIISSLSTLNTSTGLFMGSSGSVLASLTLASTLYLQGNPFLQSQSNQTIQSSATNQIQAYSQNLLQLNNSLFVSSGFVGINTSTPKYSLHVEKSLAVGGLAGANIGFRSVQYDTLIMSTLTDGTNAYVNSGLFEMSNLLIDSTVDNNTYSVTTIAGSGNGAYADGLGAAASFYQPVGIAIDSSSNLYVSDTYNHCIRLITPSGQVSTIAGTVYGGVGIPGFSNGTYASFNLPMGLILDSSSNIYVCDYNNHVIRQITPAGFVITFAGSGSPSYADGNGTLASFNGPSGITIDTAGNLYVADCGNNRIRKIDTAANVTTIAGNASATYTDGFGITASFNNPFSITIDKNNNLYIGDRLNYRIRKIDSGRNVTTIAGNGTNGVLDGNGIAAIVSWPEGICVDSTGTLFYSDFFGKVIRKISPSGTVSTIAGQVYVNGNKNGLGFSALFNLPANMVVDSTGILYLADYYNNSIRKIIPKYQVHSNTNRIQIMQSTMNVNNFVYIGQSTVGIGVSSPNYTLDVYSLGSSSNFTTYTTEVNTSIQINPNEKSIWVTASATDQFQNSNFTYSLDHGNTWSNGNDQQTWNIAKGAAYNGSYWVAPGSPIMTSTDGSNWNSVVTQGGSGSFLTGGGKVAWNGYYWIASGSSSNQAGTLLKSQDGLNWTAAATGGFTTGSVYQASDILWTGSKWIATGIGPTAVSSIQWSQDGVNWSSITSGGFLTGGNGLSFGPRIPYIKGLEHYQGIPFLFAVGNDTGLNSIQYSYDGGFNWSTITSGGFYYSGNGIDTDGKYLVALGRTNNLNSNIQIGTIQTNPLQVTFTSYSSYTGGSILPFDTNGNCVKWNGSEWLLGGNNGLRKLIPTSNSYFSSFTVGGTYAIDHIVVADTNSLNLPIYSIDSGVTYQTSPPITKGFKNRFIRSNGSNMWVAIANSNPAAYYSSDGKQWNKITNIPFYWGDPSGGQTATSLSFTNNKWFLTSYDNTNNYSTLCTSLDGINWSNIPTLSSQGVYNFMYGVGTAGGIYVAANTTALYYSYNLVSWSPVQGQIGTDGIIYNGTSVYGGGVFLVNGFTSPYKSLGNYNQYNAAHLDGSDNTGRYDTLAVNGRPFIRSTDGINWTYIYFYPNMANWYPPTQGVNYWSILTLSYSSKLGQFITGGDLRSGQSQSYANGIYLFYSYDGSTWYNCLSVKSDPAIGIVVPYEGLYLNNKWILSFYNDNAGGTTAANAYYPLWYSSDGITFSNYSIFPLPVVTGYSLSGFSQILPVLSNEIYGVAYSSNLNPILNTSSFSVFADTDINTIHSQTTNNTMHVTSNTIVLNDLFTVTDKVVNFGSYPYDPTFVAQSSLSIYQNIEITGSLLTGSATIGSLYLGIQSV